MSAYAVTDLRYAPLTCAFQFGVTVPLLREAEVLFALGMQAVVEEVERDPAHCQLIITLAREYACDAEAAAISRAWLLRVLDALADTWQRDSLSAWRAFVETLDMEGIEE